jgi:prophage tail gpP-like protein
MGGQDAQLTSSTLRVIGINELSGTDASGANLPVVADILARYKDAKVLPIRSELNVFRKSYADALVARPMFLKDDESRNIDQLSGFVRREMAKRQHKALHVKYEMMGLSIDNAPWAPNTMVTVADDVLDITGPLYVLEREFMKARTGGTKTNLTLCLPHSLDYEI